MTSVLALDLDGTLVESFTARPLAAAVAAVARLDSMLPIAIVTNQAGPTFRVAGAASYPSPSEVAENLDAGLRAVGLPPERVAALHVATWPGETWRGQPAAALSAASYAAGQLQGHLEARGWQQARVTSAPSWRKPAGDALLALSTTLLVPPAAILYIGDRDVDQQAARCASCQFQWAKQWWEGK